MISQRGGHQTATAVSLLVAMAVVLALLGIPRVSAFAQDANSAACDAPGAVRIATELLNPNRTSHPDGVSEVTVDLASPLPAGAYDVTLVSFDDHLARAPQPDQTAEQWFIVLNDSSTYTSQPANDLPDDEEHIATTFRAELTGEATTLTARHLASGTSLNSIEADCAIFDPIVPDPPPPSPPAACEADGAVQINTELWDPNAVPAPGGVSEVTIDLIPPLAAGAYNLTLVASDDHLARPPQPEQTHEQWFIVLDDESGFTSPASFDLPDDQEQISSTFPAELSSEATTLTARHVGAGTSINSINADCVIFDPIPEPESGQVIIRVITDPSGATQSFTLTPSYSDNFSLQDSEESGSEPLEAGSYSVTETVPDGWELTSATCEDDSNPDAIDLDAGETVICTFVFTLEVGVQGAVASIGGGPSVLPQLPVTGVNSNDIALIALVALVLGVALVTLTPKLELVADGVDNPRPTQVDDFALAKRETELTG